MIPKGQKKEFLVFVKGLLSWHPTCEEMFFLLDWPTIMIYISYADYKVLSSSCLLTTLFCYLFGILQFYDLFSTVTPRPGFKNGSYLQTCEKDIPGKK